MFFGFWEDVQFKRLSTEEHLAAAEKLCGVGPECHDSEGALRHLRVIPQSSRELGEAAAIRAAIDHQLNHQRDVEKQSEEQSRMQMQRNFSGEANDSFDCATSKEHEPIVSFDARAHWWKDDGRCRDRSQKAKDDDAQINSYWSTTVRVDTDMDSSWLPDEERICQTLPGSSGRAATVNCNATPHANHNIPVQFWGGVDRNTVSDWKCRRNKDILRDVFVCKAID